MKYLRYDYWNKTPFNSIKFLLVLFFLSEGLTKISYYNKFSFHNFSALVKGSFILGVVIYVSLCYKRIESKQKEIIKLLLILGVFFLIGQFTFNSDESFYTSAYSNLVFFLRYVLIFVICVFLINIYKKKFSSQVFKVYEYIVWINTTFLFLGYLFNLNIFGTYYYTRFGYNGLFLVPSISTYFYGIALSYFSFKLINNQKGVLPLFIVMLAAVLVGTKALLLFVGLTMVNLFYTLRLYRYLIFYLVLAILFLGGIFFHKSFYSFLITRYDVLYKVYQDNGLLTMLTSYRDLRVKETFPEIINNKMSVINYFFGGTDFTKYRIEFEIFDVFLFFGLIGGAVYLYSYFKFIIRFNLLDVFSKRQIVILLFVALLSGTFLNNGSVGIYLVIVLNLMGTKTNEIENSK
jgi:hypothetical protein